MIIKTMYNVSLTKFILHKVQNKTNFTLKYYIKKIKQNKKYKIRN